MQSKMVHEELSNADVNAIAKTRGFSKKEKASRAVFENFLLSEIGVEEVMSTLATEEIALLHLLSAIDRPVDISFFARHYGHAGEGQKYYRGTFNQQYKSTFKKVRYGLIRRGILLFVEDDSASGDTILERRRFRFPPKFSSFLPPMVNPEHTYDGEGNFRGESVLREKLAEILNQNLDPRRHSHMLSISNGNLLIGKRYFQTKLLQDWQSVRWERNIHAEYLSKQINLPLITAITLIFSQLQPLEWIHPSQLKTPLKILCHGRKIPPGTEICQQGWNGGNLAKHTVDGVSYYRMPVPQKETRADELPDFTTYLSPQDESVWVDLKRIPYHQLEILNRIAYLEITNGKLIAMSNLTKLGWADPNVWNLPLTQWLAENISSFETTLQLVKERWGRQIVHENLFIAKVEDLSLKVQIERSFSDPSLMLSLSNNFIAFPREQLPKIKKIVSKAGYVIKTIS